MERFESMDSSREKVRLPQTSIGRYRILASNPTHAPKKWAEPCATTESAVHQLSPYIGKLKSSIAFDLVRRFSKSDDLVVDPFSGSGTIPLEARLCGRNVFAADISPYSQILTRAKLNPPATLECAITTAESLLDKADLMDAPDIRKVPKWVRCFFHPKTLKEAINFSRLCRKEGNWFLMACFLGILHHQRPGFLSYPSSHLVPYLRCNKYPRSTFPEMYEYRSVRPRLIAKIVRAYKRCRPFPSDRTVNVRLGGIQSITLPERFDSLITSPPYMNALDYGRDNRLRLWFINPNAKVSPTTDATREKAVFERNIASLAKKVEKSLMPSGHCVLVVGEKVNRSYNAHPAEVVCNILTKCSPSLRLESVIADEIPDVRRSRKHCTCTKVEHILVFRRRT